MPRAWCLKVLSLSGIRQLTWLFDSISKMKHLRYLDISDSFIEGLPDSICMLYNLQTLKLSYCVELERLPRDTWKLINLRHLQIDETFNLKEMPIQMDRLKCLQTLSKFIVSKHDSGSSNIGELGKLINLRGKLLIKELQNVRSAKDALDARLKDKRYLEELVLKWNPLEEVLGISKSQRGVIENLQSHEKLKSLIIYYYGGRGFPNWIGSGLHSLSRLKLMYCKYCSALPPLGQLPFLNELYIYGIDGVVIVDQEFYGNSHSLMKPFGSLKLLKFKDMSNWETWENLGAENKVETFSQLEDLYIENCPKLRGRLPVYLHSLHKLVICNCQHLEGLLPIDSFPVLTHTKIAECNNLESIVLPEQHEHDGLLSKLKILVINDCKKCELPMHQQFSSLEELYLTDCCDSLVSFPLDLFPNLKRIQIKRCRNLQLLEQHGVHSAILYIKIYKCPKFVDFPRGLSAPNLATFSLDDCESLRSMPNDMHLFISSLCYLELINCPEVESFPKGGLPSNLKQIVIIRCKKLIANWKGWDLQILPSLEWLEIVSDKLEDHVESFPGGLLLLTTLTSLKISSFGNLKSLDNEGFQHLTSLVKLVIKDCPKLRNMPEEGFPASLRFLCIWTCDPVWLQDLRGKQGKEWLNVARVPNIMIDRTQIQGYEWSQVYNMRSPYEPPPSRYQF